MRFLYLVLLSIILNSCKSPENGLFQFDPGTIEEKEITLSEIADDITYIPLDNGFPISLIYDPRYFVNDNIYLSAYQSGIMIFDKAGRFVRRIGSIGRGPGEYVFYYKFTVDEKSGTVYVLDMRIVKVFSKTGRFLRSFKLEEYGEGSDVIEYFNSKIFISCHPQFEGVKYDWIVFDTLGNLVESKERSIQEFTSSYLIGGGVYKFDNRIYSWNPYSDTIFSISPDFILKPSFVISPGEHRLPREDIHNLEDLDLYFEPYMILDSYQWLIFTYYYGKKVTIALIDKKSGESFSTNLEFGEAAIGVNYLGGIPNDLDGGLRFQPENYFVENDREYLAGLIDAYEIKARVKTDEFETFQAKYPEKKKAFEELAGRLNETDNPVLMVIRLKK